MIRDVATIFQNIDTTRKSVIYNIIISIRFESYMSKTYATRMNVANKESVKRHIRHAWILKLDIA